QPDPAVLQRLAREIGAAPALRRIGSPVDPLPTPDLLNPPEAPAAPPRRAREIGAAPPLWRIGWLVDQLPIPDLVNRLEPLAAPASDIQLEPRYPAGRERPFRDRRWRVVWAQQPSAIAGGLQQ